MLIRIEFGMGIWGWCGMVITSLNFKLPYFLCLFCCILVYHSTFFYLCITTGILKIAWKIELKFGMRAWMGVGWLSLHYIDMFSNCHILSIYLDFSICA